jgi:hypothetical protein
MGELVNMVAEGHSVSIFWIVYTPYYLSNDENGEKIAVRETGQDIS